MPINSYGGSLASGTMSGRDNQDVQTSQPQSPLDSEMEILQKYLDSLRSKSLDLCGRLDPVLRPAGPTDEVAGQTQRIACSPHTERIVSFQHTVWNIERWLDDVLLRLEV